jgi:hypothetical protein
MAKRTGQCIINPSFDLPSPIDAFERPIPLIGPFHHSFVADDLEWPQTIGFPPFLAPWLASNPAHFVCCPALVVAWPIVE